jgi:phage gpG-like protein
MIRAVLIGSERVKERLDRVYSRAQVELLASMSRIVIALARKIKEEKLSGQVLKNRTGTLRRSITPSVNMGGSTIQGQVGTNVEYAAIHEYGGTTPPHEIWPRHAKALAFMMRGRNVIVRSVHHPGSRIPEASFMRSSLEEMRPEIRAEFADAIAKVVKES